MVSLVVGCGPGGEATSSAGPANAPASLVLSAEAPHLVDGQLGVLVKDGSEKVQVGMNQDRAMEIFKSPVNILGIDSLPKGIPAETYSAGGWETIDETSGFGFIAVKSSKEIATAIRTRRFDTKDEADAEIQQYERAFTSIPDRTAKQFLISGSITYSYTFWQEASNRLMVLEAPTGKKWQVTVMLGEKSLMDVLRASLASATQDMVRLDSMHRPSAPAKVEPSATH